MLKISIFCLWFVCFYMCSEGKEKELMGEIFNSHSVISCKWAIQIISLNFWVDVHSNLYIRVRAKLHWAPDPFLIRIYRTFQQIFLKLLCLWLTRLWRLICISDLPYINRKKGHFWEQFLQKHLFGKDEELNDSGALAALMVAKTCGTRAVYISLCNLFPLWVYWWKMAPCLLLSKHIFQKTSKCSQQNRANSENIGLFHWTWGITSLASIVYQRRNIIFFKVQTNKLCCLWRKYDILHCKQSCTLTT